MRKQLLTMITVGCAIMYASPSHATLAISVFDNGTQVGSTATSSTGALTFSGSDTFFASISVSANGIPVLTSPDLASNTLDATTTDGFTGPRTLEVDVVQTGIAPFSGSQNTTGTFDALIGSPGPVTEKMFVNGVAIVTQTLSGPVSSFGPTGTSVSGLTSDEEQFLITFTDHNQSASASMQFVGASSAVPEPGSLMLLGSALFTLGWLGRRRKRSSSAVGQD